MQRRFGLRWQRYHQSASRRCWRKRGELAQGIGRSRGGRGSKVDAAVDQFGRPLLIDVTGAQTHDSKAFGAFVHWNHPPLAIVADKAYGSKAIRQAIADEGALAVIPSKSNAKIHIPHHPDLYAMRNLVERFFCRMKDMRRLTMRYEKLKQNYLAMVHMFAIRCWLNWVQTLIKLCLSNIRSTKFLGYLDQVIS